MQVFFEETVKSLISAPDAVACEMMLHRPVSKR
jgi:hypothetical protein